MIFSRPITVVIMAGGCASRLESHADRDKTMVRMNGVPFMAYIVSSFLRSALVEQVVVAAGRHAVVNDYLRQFRPRVIVRQETDVHGTAGDLLKALAFVPITTPHVLAVNGDTALSLDIDGFFMRHVDAALDCTIALTHTTAAGIQNCGAFLVDDAGLIVYTHEADPALRAQPPQILEYHPMSATGAILYRSEALWQNQWLHSALLGNRLLPLSAEKVLVPNFVLQRQAAAFDNGLRLVCDNGTPERMRIFRSLDLSIIYGPPLMA